MQIFLPSENIMECAKALDDKRLNKIVVESAQIASTVLWINDCDIAETLTANGKCYLPTHENHPLVRWCASSNENFSFVLDYLFELCVEYTYRFEKRHKTADILFSLANNSGRYVGGKKVGVVTPINATTHYKHINWSVYEAYRLEMAYKWNNQKKPPVWTRRCKPSWYC